MKAKRVFCATMMILVLALMCLVFLGTAATYAVPARAAGTWGSANYYDGLDLMWPFLGSISGLLASAARTLVYWLAALLSALGFWAAIGGGIWYVVVRRGDYSTKTRWYALATLLIGVIAFLIGTAMLVLDVPGRVYLAVLLRMLR